MSPIAAVLFDFSGTLFRLEASADWFDGVAVDREVLGAPDGQVHAELTHRMTAPTGTTVPMPPDVQHAWTNRDLAPDLHREAYSHVLRASGVAEAHTDSLYARMVDPASWTPYPDTAEVLRGLRARGVRTAVVSNIAFDLRPAFAALGAGAMPDEFALSFEVGAMKPDPAIFTAALARLGVPAQDALMVGDSEEADGGATAVGCRFALVDPAPTAQRRTGLLDALRAAGVPL